VDFGGRSGFDNFHNNKCGSYRKTRLNIKKKSPLNAGNFIGLDGQDAESIS